MLHWLRFLIGGILILIGKFLPLILIIFFVCFVLSVSASPCLSLMIHLSSSFPPLLYLPNGSYQGLLLSCNSLISTVRFHRPDLLCEYKSNSHPIPLNPPNEINLRKSLLPLTSSRSPSFAHSVVVTLWYRRSSTRNRPIDARLLPACFQRFFEKSNSYIFLVCLYRYIFYITYLILFYWIILYVILFYFI